MILIRRWTWATRLVVLVVGVALFSAVCGMPSRTAGAVIHGAKTSDEAARMRSTGEESPPLTLAGWRPSMGYVASTADDDTTEVDFPIEEELKREHLYRDIAIFLVLSAFVGYFIVKVFLEGDTDEPPPPKKGKQIPGS